MENTDIVFNWHLTQACNFLCEYCFATWEKIEDEDIWKNFTEAELLFEKLAEYGKSQDKNIRINFAGGEPLLLGEKLHQYVKLAKLYNFKTSIITNASLFLKNISLVENLDMLGISIDSLDAEVCKKIGRQSKKGQVISKNDLTELVKKARNLNSNIDIKFNCVVNKHNLQEQIIKELQVFKPAKIKILRQLPFANNKGITDKEFQDFLKINSAFIKQNCVLEDNQDMTESYLMIDPKGRFFQNGNSKSYVYSDNICNIGVSEALKSIRFNFEKYNSRYKKIQTYSL